MLNTFLVAFINFFILMNSCFAYNANNNYESSGKIYISPNQVHILESEIFVLIDDFNLIEVNQINSDENGIYIPLHVAKTREIKKCKNGHMVVCSKCNGCVNSRTCIYACRCYGMTVN